MSLPLLLSLLLLSAAEQTTDNPLLKLLETPDCVCGGNYTIGSPETPAYRWAEFHSNSYKYSRTGYSGDYCIEDCEWRLRSADGGSISLLFNRIDTPPNQPVILWDGQPKMSPTLAVCSSSAVCHGLYNSSRDVLSVTFSSSDRQLDLAGLRPVGFSASVALRPWRVAYHVLRFQLATRSPPAHSHMSRSAAIACTVVGGIACLGGLIVLVLGLRRCKQMRVIEEMEAPPPPLPLHQGPPVPAVVPLEEIPPPDYESVTKEQVPPPSYESLANLSPSPD